MRRWLAAALLLGGLTPAATTTASAPPGGAPAFPGDDWATASPAEMGLDGEVLDQLAVDAAMNGANCLAVVRHGYLVAEWYWNDWTPDTTQEVFSVTKSFTSTLVGIAAAQGDLDVGEPAADFITEWSGTDSAGVTVEHLLSNDSGREWSLALDYGQLILAPDRSAFAIDLGQDAAPGTVWVYNNAAIQALSEVLQTATGVEPAAYAEEHLFTPIGMADSEMTTDGAGNTLTFMGLRSNCRDLARYGVLYLNDGNWDGNQVVPADWVEASIGQPSQEINAAYGYLWWLNRPGPVVGATAAVTVGDDSTSEGPVVPDAPEDMYWALGLGNQIVQVDPGSDTVVVRVGGIDGEFDRADTARVVTEALTDPPDP